MYTHYNFYFYCKISHFVVLIVNLISPLGSGAIIVVGNDNNDRNGEKRIIMNTRTSSVVTPQQQHNQKRIQRLLKTVPSNLSVTYHHVFLEIY